MVQEARWLDFYHITPHMDKTQWIGIIAGVFTASSMLPQLIKTIKEKKAEEISELMLVVLIAGVSLWIWYGILKKDLPIIATNAISLTVNLLMIFFRVKYRNNS